MSRIVLDASAVLAMTQDEPGGERVAALLFSKKHEVAISAVNLSEVLARLKRVSNIADAENLLEILSGVEVVAFSFEEAEATAEMIKEFPSLSLGDRACLSLAQSRGAKAWTADRVWASKATQFDIEVIR